MLNDKFKKSVLHLGKGKEKELNSGDACSVNVLNAC